jgi:hypothetical protein
VADVVESFGAGIASVTIKFDVRRLVLLGVSFSFGDAELLSPESPSPAVLPTRALVDSF